jgi:SSS family solute:Na+ symporter
MLGLFTRAFNGWALLAGWAAGIACGVWMASTLGFKGTTFPLHLFGIGLPGYAALYAVIVNLAVSGLLSGVLNAVASDRHRDVTTSEDYA